MDNEIKENVISKNREAETDKPQIHLNDAPFAEEATELVFHKMPDGNLFIEWYHPVTAKLKKVKPVKKIIQ